VSTGTEKSPVLQSSQPQPQPGPAAGHTNKRRGFLAAARAPEVVDSRDDVTVSKGNRKTATAAAGTGRRLFKKKSDESTANL